MRELPWKEFACTVLFVGLIASIAGLGLAQVPASVKQPNTANRTDAQIVGWLLVDNQVEVALGHMAEQRAKNENVKEFARQMVKDHFKFADRLQPFASNDTAANTPRAATAGLDLVDLKQRLGKKCLESAQKELEAKEGTEFDQCYAMQQAMAHVMVLDSLEVFKEFASPQLRAVIDEGISTTEMHIKHAKELA